VVRNGEVVGIVTETDLFKIFLELLGAREAGIRLAALVANRPGELAKLTAAVYQAGGNFLALVTSLGESTENRLVTAKVEGVELPALKRIVEPLVQRVVDIRPTVAG
jgi:acetoin utilization protein AcuB